MDFLGGLQLEANSSVTLFFGKSIALILVLYIYYITRALCAYFLGDKSTRIREALTLNVFKALEPVGLILFFALNCGWAKQINVSFLNIKDRTKATYIIYLLPNFMILLTGIILVATLNIAGKLLSLDMINYYYYFVWQFVFYTCTYIILNLLPVAPFDLYNILTKVGKPNVRMYLSNNEKIFQMVFVFLLLFGVLNVLITPFTSFFINLMLSFAS